MIEYLFIHMYKPRGTNINKLWIVNKLIPQLINTTVVQK